MNGMAEFFLPAVIDSAPPAPMSEPAMRVENTEDTWNVKTISSLRF